jgi:hypothetical protein
MNFVHRFLYRHGWRHEGKEYCDLVSAPVHNMLSLDLLQAVDAGADSMAIGTPDGADLEAVERLSLPQTVIPPVDLPQAERAVALDSARVRGENEDTFVPIWYRIGGEWRLSHPHPASVYIDFLAAIRKRLVSINSSSRSYQPIKWIEFTRLEPDTQRHFIELKEIVVSSRQCVVLMFGQYRGESPGVRVTRYINGGTALTALRM